MAGRRGWSGDGGIRGCLACSGRRGAIGGDDHVSSDRGGFTATRVELHRVAAHILARRRHDVSGRFGLRPSPGGFATPAFGEGPEVVRVANGTLVREAAGGASYLPLAGASLRRLAE